MIELKIPGQDKIILENIVFDLNGTLAIDGRISPDNLELLKTLRGEINLIIVTAGTHGNLDLVKEETGIDVVKIEPRKEAEQKLEYISKLGLSKTAAVGNGQNDILMLKKAVLSIVVLEKEGCVPEAISSSDILVKNTADLLNLFLNPNRIVATLRK